MARWCSRYGWFEGPDAAVSAPAAPQTHTTCVPCPQTTSTASRVPLAERQQNSTSTTLQAAGKRSSGKHAPPSSRHAGWCSISLTTAAPRRAGVLPAPRKLEQWKDIDAENQDNPLACSEYAQQIFEYLNSAEVRLCVVGLEGGAAGNS